MTSLIAVQTCRIVVLAAVLIMAGLAAILSEIDDAAKVDGAGFWLALVFNLFLERFISGFTRGAVKG